jgi:hypothetical protein
VCSSRGWRLDPKPLHDFVEALTADAKLLGGRAFPAAGSREGGAYVSALELHTRFVESACADRRPRGDVFRKDGR